MSTGLDFTTLARVRTALGFEVDDVSRDAEISRLVRAVSSDMEGELRRFVKVAAYTEILPLWSGTREVWVQGIPVADSPAIVINASNQRDFVTSPTLLVLGQDFILENETGCIRIMTDLRGIRDRFSGHAIAPAYLQIAYTGGMSTTTASFMDAYPQLAGAAELQTSYLYQRQKSPGGNLVVGPSSNNFEQAYNWLPSVRRTIDYYKRRSVA